MKLNFGQDVLVLPASVLSHPDADACALRVLLWVASDLSLSQKPKQLAKLADCDVKSVNDALSFWREKGILSSQEAPQGQEKIEQIPVKKAEKSERKSPLRRADELPSYSSAELAELLEKRAAVRALVDEAQRHLGKMFNPSEINILVGMYDYLGLSEEGILLLIAHCKKIGKVNLRAIEKYAYTLVERDIMTPEALDEEFQTVEALYSFEGQVRAMFGMKSRALTSRESKMLRAWVEYGYDIEIVRRAYEMTISSTNEPSVAYANAIIERWHADGLQSLAEIDRAQEEKKEKKTGKKFEPTLGNSFDTDDFFEAALKRSFRDTEGGDS